MSDDIDRAQMRDAQLREAALAAHRAKHLQHNTASREQCLDCDEVIPLARREAIRGCLRCAFCQQVVERAEAR